MVQLKHKEHTAFNVETPLTYQHKEMDSASPQTPSNALGGVCL